MYSYFPTIDLTATGKNIIKLRKARGLTVKDIQKFFGFEEPQAVYKWQQGKSLPTVDNLFALSVLLGVPMEAILVSTNQNYKDEQAVKPAHCFLYSAVCDVSGVQKYIRHFLCDSKSETEISNSVRHSVWTKCPSKIQKISLSLFRAVYGDVLTKYRIKEITIKR